MQAGVHDALVLPTRLVPVAMAALDHTQPPAPAHSSKQRVATQPALRRPPGPLTLPRLALAAAAGPHVLLVHVYKHHRGVCHKDVLQQGEGHEDGRGKGREVK